MRDFVGVRSCYEYGNIAIKQWFSPKYSSSLKNQSLLFDKIGIVNLESYLIPVSMFEPANPDLQNLLYLQEKGIVFDYNVQRTWSDVDKLIKFQMFLNQQGMGDYPMKVNHAQKKRLDATAEFVKNAQSILEDRLRDFLQLDPNNPAHTNKIEELSANSGREIDELKDQLRERMLENDSGEVRLVAMWMEQFENAEVIPLLPYHEYLKDIPGSKKTDAIEIVIRELPIPDEETPWEKIIEYRMGPYFIDDRRRLRRWITKISSESHPPVEIGEELEYLIDLYTKHLNIHDIKLKFGQLKTLIKLPFDIASQILHFDIAKLPDPLFDIFERRISLWEAELNAPGNEIAYIIKTKDAFD